MQARILDSARKHGITDAAIKHALKLPYRIIELESPMVLIIGPNRTGELLEVIVANSEHDPRVIHAMKLRTRFFVYL